MIGTVAYINHSRRFALITPAGKSRDHDIAAAETQFLFSGCFPPILKQQVQFEVDRTHDGSIEAVNIRVSDGPVSNGNGARPAALFAHGEAAGNILESR